MGEVVGAGILAHVPTIMLPEETRRELNNGPDFTLVDALRDVSRAPAGRSSSSPERPSSTRGSAWRSPCGSFPAPCGWPPAHCGSWSRPPSAGTGSRATT